MSFDVFSMSLAYVWQLSLIALAGALIAAWLTRPLIGWLESRQFGKAIRVDGPDHAAKSGTPTMGGIGMLASAAITILLALAWLRSVGTDLSADPALIARNGVELVVILIGFVLFSAIGLVDDLQGLARRSGKRELGVGIQARHMLALQWLGAIGLGWVLLSTNTRIMPASWPAWVSLLVAGLVIVGTVNGVNLSDGLDGLAAGLLAIAFAGLALISLASALIHYDSTIRVLPDRVGAVDAAVQLGITRSFALVLIAAAVAGACLGFLWFNRHPARVFMGNVASMGLGALLALLALASGTWILLPVLGVIFVAESLSVIVQVGYFKYSGGKRIFRMAPFHHHFELGGMHETTIVRRFWAAGLIAAFASIALAGPILDRFAVLLPTYR